MQNSHWIKLSCFREKNILSTFERNGISTDFDVLKYLYYAYKVGKRQIYHISKKALKCISSNESFNNRYALELELPLHNIIHVDPVCFLHALGNKVAKPF